jgi:hypothetical protein
MTLSPTGAIILERQEKDEEKDADRFVARLGGTVIRLSQRRKSKVFAGLPDRRYHVFGFAMWAEIKTDKGQITRAQYEFLKAEHALGNQVFAGTAQALARFLQDCDRGRVTEKNADAGWLAVDNVAARGFRGEPKGRLLKDGTRKFYTRKGRKGRP